MLEDLRPLRRSKLRQSAWREYSTKQVKFESKRRHFSPSRPWPYRPHHCRRPCSTLGVGTNQPDVEAVICVGFPPSLEDMVQKYGRARRDGRPAKGKYMCMWKSDVHLMKISYLTLFQGCYSITSQTCNMPHSGVGVHLSKRCYQHTKKCGSSAHYTFQIATHACLGYSIVWF